MKDEENVMASRAGEWRAMGAVAAGRSHEAAGTPCQDAFDSCTRWRKSNVAMALADGAGSRPLSHLGAQAVTNKLCRYAAHNFDSLWKSSDAEIARRLLACAQRVLEKLSARHDGSRPDDFACTFMLVACSGERALTANLGDGVVAMRTPTGTWSALLPPQRGEHANETHFLTSPNTMEHFRIAKTENTGSAFLIMTDGAADSLYERSTGRIAPAAESFVGWFQNHPRKTAQQALQNTISTTLRSRTHDDCGVGVINRKLI